MLLSEDTDLDLKVFKFMKPCYRKPFHVEIFLRILKF